MPAWIHDRAEHLLAKNPAMPKSQAFAIATQQAHAIGKSPKGYGTTEGRSKAKKKYDTPKDDKKTANPGDLRSEKMASNEMNVEMGSDHFWKKAMVMALFDELEKISASVPPPLPKPGAVKGNGMADALFSGMKSAPKSNVMQQLVPGAIKKIAAQLKAAKEKDSGAFDRFLGGGAKGVAAPAARTMAADVAQRAAVPRSGGSFTPAVVGHGGMPTPAAKPKPGPGPLNPGGGMH